jgi:hypothetical protein
MFASRACVKNCLSRYSAKTLLAMLLSRITPMQGTPDETRGAHGPVCGALTALALLALASAGPAAISQSELLADPDRFDGQTVTLQGTVEKSAKGFLRTRLPTTSSA